MTNKWRIAFRLWLVLGLTTIIAASGFSLQKKDLSVVIRDFEKRPKANTSFFREGGQVFETYTQASCVPATTLRSIGDEKDPDVFFLKKFGPPHDGIYLRYSCTSWSRVLEHFLWSVGAVAAFGLLLLGLWWALAPRRVAKF